MVAADAAQAPRMFCFVRRQLPILRHLTRLSYSVQFAGRGDSLIQLYYGNAVIASGKCNFTAQNRPEMTPLSSTSMRSAAGDFGRPGIVMISPVSATMKPAPALTLRFRTVMR